jgi:hypothetical protein
VSTGVTGGFILVVVISVIVVDLDGVLRTWEKRSFAILEARYGLPDGSMNDAIDGPIVHV